MSPGIRDGRIRAQGVNTSTLPHHSCAWTFLALWAAESYRLTRGLLPMTTISLKEFAAYMYSILSDEVAGGRGGRGGGPSNVHVGAVEAT